MLPAVLRPDSRQTPSQTLQLPRPGDRPLEGLIASSAPAGQQAGLPLLQSPGPGVIARPCQSYQHSCSASSQASAGEVGKAAMASAARKLQHHLPAGSAVRHHLSHPERVRRARGLHRQAAAVRASVSRGCRGDRSPPTRAATKRAQ